ncbi:MAG: HK97 family phage prohead protease [Bryobacteraceae bacterium]
MAEVRAAGGDGQPKVLEGYAAVFDRVTELWPGMNEVIRKGAFSESLKRGDDVRALWNHDASLVLGRTKSGTLSLSEDDKGLLYRVLLNESDPEAMRVYGMIARGDVDQSSFGFMIPEDGERFVKDQNGARVREVLRADLFDVSPVTFPAYNDTVVMAREAFRRAPSTANGLEAIAIKRHRLGLA